jgi:hypothetical protein
MLSTQNLRIILAALSLAISSFTEAGVITANFDDLPSLPGVTSATSLSSANNNSLTYDGIVWDSGLSVAGDQYRISQSGPTYGIPNSGHYFVTNNNGGSVSVMTSLPLIGAWFGRNEYYGFGGGADQITIVALSGNTALSSVVFNLPETHPGQPEPLSFVDTSAFLALSGITGYRIDSHAPSQFQVNWIADDFQFVPNPNTWTLFIAALPGWLFLKRRQHKPC